MTYETFRQALEAMVEEIPDVFLQGLQGIHALEEERVEEGYEDVFRMGEYLDPGPDDFLGGSDGLGRHVALYWGSFKAIAEDDPDFDWDEELWETLTHELQHHVESLAGDGRLIEEDLKQARAWTNAADEEPVEVEATRQDRAQQVDAPVAARIRRWFTRSGRREAPSDEEA